MKKLIMLAIVLGLLIAVIPCFAFELYPGQSKAEVIAGLGEPTYTEIEFADSLEFGQHVISKHETYFWESISTTIEIHFYKDKIVRYIIKHGNKGNKGTSKP
jgi:hypothetical protein